MKIKAVKFRKDGFYTQPFVFGGEEGPEKFDKNVRYRGSLQNYLIDTGSEVILVDTGLPAGFPEEVPNEDSLIFTGKDISSYMDAFKALGFDVVDAVGYLLAFGEVVVGTVGIADGNEVRQSLQLFGIHLFLVHIDLRIWEAFQLASVVSMLVGNQYLRHLLGLIAKGLEGIHIAADVFAGEDE